jgi:hypothetical protein
MRGSSDSRTEISSSTTNTMGVTLVMTHDLTPEAKVIARSMSIPLLFIAQDAPF